MGSFRNNYMNDDIKEFPIKLKQRNEEFSRSFSCKGSSKQQVFLYINPSFTSQIVGFDKNRL